MKRIRDLDIVILAATVGVALLLAALVWNSAWGAPRSEAAPRDTGFLVVAPDRGFLGNEEIRDAFEAFAARHNAALVVVTDERTRAMLAEALATITLRGAHRAVVLPLFLSPQDPRLAKLRTWVAERPRSIGAPAMPITYGKSFGESYLAVEVLADRLRALQNPAGRRVIVAGHGADSTENRRQLEADWQRLAERAAEGIPFESMHALVWYDAPPAERAARGREMEAALAQAAESGERVVAVPFHLGRKLDSRMAFTNVLKHTAPHGVDVAAEGALPSEVLTWMEREANRKLPLTARNTGVVVLAHGGDYHWNETLRAGVRELERRYPIEYCFSMADPPLVERAIRRLEQRGVRAIVIVRVFSSADSFKRDIERLIGLDIEEPSADTPAGHGDHAVQGHGHDHDKVVPRIRTAAIVRSAGGIEDHVLFARALLARARMLSKDPARETVILTAHGAEDDASNARWLASLESLAARMRAESGGAFRAIRFITWREDWPEKRAPWIAKAREMVQQANHAGGRALVVPARVAAPGPERRFLEGLDYALGTGFAPHPLFARWVEEQVKRGVAAIQREKEVPQTAANIASN